MKRIIYSIVFYQCGVCKNEYEYKCEAKQCERLSRPKEKKIFKKGDIVKFIAGPRSFKGKRPVKEVAVVEEVNLASFLSSPRMEKNKKTHVYMYRVLLHNGCTTSAFAWEMKLS